MILLQARLKSITIRGLKPYMNDTIGAECQLWYFEALGYVSNQVERQAFEAKELNC